MTSPTKYKTAKDHLDVSPIDWDSVRSKYPDIPDLLFGGIKRYIVHRAEPGSGLKAILENDFKGAVTRMTSSELGSMRAIAILLENEVPHVCWGSPENVRGWLATR